MPIVRTLDYIVNTDLHLYLFEKFDDARSKGIQIEIKLTESITHIPVDFQKYIEIVDMILDNAIDSLLKSAGKKIDFYMFYADGELNFVTQYSCGKEQSGESLDKALKKYKNFYFYIDNKKGTTTQHLAVR